MAIQVTFEKDPEQYCKDIYAEALERSNKIRPIDEENRLLYEGIDKNLEARRNDPMVERSALHIPEVAPAIDTRIGEAVSKVNETATPIVCTPKDENLSQQQKDDVAFTQRTLTLQLRESGYLTDIWEEHMRGAEIYRSPSVVKIGWENKSETVIDVQEPSIIDSAIAALQGRSPKPKVSYKFKSVGQPYVDWLSRDQFLYEPNRSDFDKTMRYKIHPDWFAFDELMATAKELDWDIGKIQKAKDDIGTGSSTAGDADKLHREEVEAGRETPYDIEFKDGKFLVTENYVVTFDDAGHEVVNLAVMVGNKYLVFNKRAPLKLMKDPFVELVSLRLPGTTENFSSMDRGKHMQRINDEAYNSYLDALSYRTFPPMKAPYGMRWKGQPVWGLGRIWYVSDPDSLQPVIPAPAQLPDLPNVIAAISTKLRHMLNAQDLSQGFQEQQHEKATATKLRALGAARSSTPRHKRYGEAIIRVAEKFLALNRQFHEDRERFAVDVEIDVPALTSVTDPDGEKMNALMLIEQTANDPLYQTPSGIRKRRALWEDAIRMFKKTNLQDYYLTEEELDSDLQSQAELQTAVLEQEQAQQELAASLQQSEGAGEAKFIQE